uniref:RNase H type-1 domain-containing protein n=1 Tax=Quercus lobata TaxID=97700 RepID=A0A7N2LU35_QUELO
MNRNIEDFKAANVAHNIPHQHVVQQWSSPHGSVYKVNVDGAVFAVVKEAGVVVIICCDDYGTVMAAMSKCVKRPLGELEIEAKAFEAGVQLRKRLG